MDPWTSNSSSRHLRLLGSRAEGLGLLGLRGKGLGAWSLVLIGKVPGAHTPGSEGEEDRVATAVFLIGEILEDYIPGSSREEIWLGVGGG